MESKSPHPNPEGAPTTGSAAEERLRAAEEAELGTLARPGSEPNRKDVTPNPTPGKQ